MHPEKCILKRIHKGAYEYRNFLVLRIPWVNEKWDGPRDRFRGWKVYATGSWIERRVLLDSFASRKEAYAYLKLKSEQEPAGQ